MVVICDAPYSETTCAPYFEEFPFPLSDFQKYSIQAIVEGQHVLVTAHTGSGKTLPAEFAIRHFTRLGKKVVYTCPIKALSNQKYYDFTKKYPDITFGLFTGDIKANPDADVLIMTTEILMNALFHNETASEKQTLQFQLDIDRDLACVVFDEVHYINDADRGQNWEKTMLMLPKHIQMVMLSATIDNPARFAKWAERGYDKQVYLASTNHRVVPLSHYVYLTTTEAVFKGMKDKALEQDIRNSTNTLIPLQDDKGKFNDAGYLKLVKLRNLFEQKQVFLKRKHVLNNLALFLRDREMLPAIVFVFSRKLVEQLAQDITVPVLEDDSKVGYNVRRECEQIVRRLSNYHEYLELPEYNTLVSLLEKGIGIHHSGMIPILREIVELMISKKYIKILFATESFAIGLDCPIKTTVFSALKKFDGRGERQLFSHEYTQMAGRAGRRGIDTIGYVVHCNNLFDVPSMNDYRDMLSGKPQQLVSKFRINYSLILNLLKNNEAMSLGELVEFAKQSMIHEELISSIQHQRSVVEEHETLAGSKTQSVECSIRTPLSACQSYLYLETQLKMAVNKKRKEIERDMAKLIDLYVNIKTDVSQVKALDDLRNSLEKEKNHLDYLERYFEDKVGAVSTLLCDQGFIEYTEEKLSLTVGGKVAASIAEIHPLIFYQMYHAWNAFEDFTVDQLIGLLATFTDIKVGEEYRRDRPYCEKDRTLQRRLQELADMYRAFDDLEMDREIYTGIDYSCALNFDITDFVLDWIACTNEQECKYFIQNVIQEKEISVGDYTKAMMKISAVVKEWTGVAEQFEEIEFLHKLSQIDGKILKYVTTSQSLYL